MASNAAHGGARAGSGRPRSGPANSAPGFAASGKRQRTLDGLLGFQSQRSSNTQQVADADGEESGASDSHAGMAMDASESGSVDATGAAAASAATSTATSPGQLPGLVAGQGSPASPALESAAVEQTPDPTQAASSATSTFDRVQSHGAATHSAVRETMPRNAGSKAKKKKSRRDIASEINESEARDKDSLDARNIWDEKWRETFPWISTVPTELEDEQQPECVGCVGCAFFGVKYGMTDAIAKGALLGKSRELRQEKIRGHDGDKKHQNAMKEWLRWREENGDGEMPNLVPGSAKGTVPKGIVNLLKVVVNFQIFNGLGLVFGHFQTNQLSVGFLSKTEPIKFILKSQEPVAALVIPHTGDP